VKHPNLFLGQAGLHRVLAELLRRGVNAYIPAIDVGVDLLTGTGLRVQVKSGRLRTRNATAPAMRGPAYFFAPSVKYRGSPERRQRGWTFRRFAEEVDFVVFWGIDEDRFWIIPASLADGLKSLVLHPGRTTGQQGSRTQAVYAHERRWDLLGAAPEVTTSNEAPALHVIGA
jgi:hypothetical protein